jgi:hypothetical protein
MRPLLRAGLMLGLRCCLALAPVTYGGREPGSTMLASRNHGRTDTVWPASARSG